MCKCQTCSHATEIIDDILHCDEDHFENCSPGKGECSSCKGIVECGSYSLETKNTNYWTLLSETAK